MTHDSQQPKKPAATKGQYDERVYRRGNPPNRAPIALIAIALLIAGTYLAWTKELPFQHHYELHAVFNNAANIRAKSPVRIAGVNVGEVTEVESVGNAAEVTFNVKDAGLPIHDDARDPDPAPDLPRGQLLPRRQAGQPAAPRSWTTAPPSRSPRPRPRCSSTRSSPRCRSPTARTWQAAAGIRHRPQPHPDRGRGPGPGSRRPGRNRWPGDRRQLQVRSVRRAGHRDRQRGAPGDRATRPLAAAQLIQHGFRRPAHPRAAAQGPGHQLQHDHERLRRRVDLAQRRNPRAGSDAGDRPPGAAQPQQHAARPARLLPRHHPRDQAAPGDDQGGQPLVQAGQAAVASRSTWAESPTTCDTRHRGWPGSATVRWDCCPRSS